MTPLHAFHHVSSAVLAATATTSNNTHAVPAATATTSDNAHSHKTRRNTQNLANGYQSQCTLQEQPAKMCWHNTGQWENTLQSTQKGQKAYKGGKTESTHVVLLTAGRAGHTAQLMETACISAYAHSCLLMMYLAPQMGQVWLWSWDIVAKLLAKLQQN